MNGLSVVQHGPMICMFRPGLSLSFALLTGECEMLKTAEDLHNAEPADATEEQRRTIFGKPLCQARKAAGWKKGYLARLLGISKAEVSALEKGVQPVPVDLCKLLEQLHEFASCFHQAITEP
jgi:hypothetical protein